MRIPKPAALVAMLGLITACTASSAGTGRVLRLGYFPTITHATAIAGVESGIFRRALGGTALAPSIFSAGPEAVVALFSGAIDAAYIGPSPAINAFTRSNGEAIRVVAGAASGGAALVVKPSIANVAALAGRTLASPQRGNTQDVALRSWLAAHGFAGTGRGSVSVVSQENSQTLETFKSGEIDGAWVPEPWPSRLVVEGGGRVLVDERTLWPAGTFATTLLVVRTAYLTEHPDAVRRLIQGHVEANDFLNRNPGHAKRIVGGAVAKLTGKALAPTVIERAWSTLTFDVDPLIATLLASAERAERLGYLANASLNGIEDLTLLNRVLRDAGKPEIGT